MQTTQFDPDDKIKMIDSKLVEALSPIEPESLYEAARHLLTADGKKIRPLLTLLSCEAMGGNPKDTLDVAIAIELLHIASLIHDDILDGDNLRRGKRAVHSIWGTQTAIIAGDLLIGKAIEIATRTGSPRVLNSIAQATIEMCEGEILEKELRENLETMSKELCLKIIRKKSASLIRVAAESGAIIGGGAKDAIISISKYGEFVGMAYQIRDDILNVVSTESVLKKPVNTDLPAMRPNLVLLHYINREQDKGITDIQEIANSFSEKAKIEIENLTLSPASRKVMNEFADFASKRLC